MDILFFRKKLVRTRGYFLRRIIHLAVILVPFIYYWYGDFFASWFFLNVDQWLSLSVGVIILLEILRIRQGWLWYGQQEHETKQFSAFGWTCLSLGLVLLQAPKIGLHHAALGAPLIWSFALADPIMGEIRLQRRSQTQILLAGILVVAIIWTLSFFWLGTPFFLIPVMAMLIALCEQYSPTWLDDNATMLLLPLALLLYLQPWRILS